MTVTFTKNLRGVADLLFGDSTTTQAQTRDLLGTATAVNVQRIDSAVIPLSTAAKTLLSLTGTQYLDAAFTTLASSVSVATTSTLGTVRISTAAAVPVALITDDPRVGYIPTSAQKDGLTGTPAEYTISGYTAPSTTNGYLTEGQTDAALYGTGRDGVFKVGAVAANATVSALVEVASSGVIPAGTYNYKVTAGNATGETNVSAASSNIVLAGSTSAVTLTVPVNGDADCAWRKIYRSDNTGAGTYRLIGYIPDNTTTTFRDTLAYGGTAAPGGDTTGASLTLPAGEYHFVGDVTLPTTTLSGDVVIRCTGTFTNSGVVTGTGSGNGNSTLRPNTPTGTYSVSAYATPGPPGFGANVRAIAPPSAGTQSGPPNTGSPFAGGAPGAMLIIYAHRIHIGANVTLNGADGTSGAVQARTNPGGGGGAGGILACVARDTVTAATVTVATNGGNGGNGNGTGGASLAYGGGGGGGGAFIAIAPSVNISTVTHNKNVGTIGTNSNTCTGGSTAMGGQGGTCAGDGDGYAVVGSGAMASNGVRSATAGQTITVTSHPFPLRIG